MRVVFSWASVCTFSRGRVAIAIWIATSCLLIAAQSGPSPADRPPTIATLQTLAQLHPEIAQRQLDLGLALVRAGRLREAIEPLKRAAADPALSDEARFLLGVDYFESHDGASAIKSLGGLEQSIHAERVLYILEESYRTTGQFEQARASFRQLNTRYPDGPWTHLLMASAYENQAQPEKAIAEYTEALAKDPSMPNVHFAIGYLHWRQGDLEEARRWFTQEFATTSCHSLANYYLGEISRTEHDLVEAESRYRQATVCDGRYGDAQLRLGTVLANAGRAQDALSHLRKAAELMPAQSAPHYQMAMLYRHLGQNSRAEAEYEIVRTLKAKLGETDAKPGAQ